jgi:hypothetical protein
MTAVQTALKADDKFEVAQELIDDVVKRIVAKQAEKSVKAGRAAAAKLKKSISEGRTLLRAAIKDMEEPDEPDVPDPVPQGATLLEMAGRKPGDYLLRSRSRAGKTVDTRTIKAALAEAKRGDVLQLKAGTYHGNYVLAASGVKITFADKKNRPVMNGRIDVTGNDDAIEGLVFDGDTAVKIYLGGKHNRVAGNWIRNRTREDAAACIVDAGYRNLVENNLIENSVGAAIQTGTWETPPDDNQGWYRNNIIRGLTAGKAQGSDPIAVGLNYGGQKRVGGCVVEGNVIEGCDGSEGDVIAQKSSGNIVGANRVRRSGSLRMRGGKSNVLALNVVEDGSIAFGGSLTLALGNEAPRIDVLAGDHDADEAGEGVGAAKNCRAVLNRGKLVVGSIPGSRAPSVPVRGLLVEAHQGSIEGDPEAFEEVLEATEFKLPDIKAPDVETIGPDFYWDNEPDTTPIDPPIDPPPPPIEGKEWWKDEVWGGDIGSGNRRVIEGDKAQFIGKPPSFSENTDYVNPVFAKFNTAASGRGEYIGERIPTGVRLINPTFENIDAAGYFIYLNHGHDEEKNQLFLVIAGGHATNVRAGKAFAEVKGSVYLCDGLEVDQNCKFGQYWRHRHGRQGVVRGGKSHGEIAAKAWCFFADVPGCSGQSWAGILPPRFKGGIDGGWGRLHGGTDSAFAGGAWQCTEGMYFGPGLKEVRVGIKAFSVEEKNKYPAFDNIVHPSHEGQVKFEKHQGTIYKELEHYKQLWAKYGFA